MDCVGWSKTKKYSFSFLDHLIKMTLGEPQWLVFAVCHYATLHDYFVDIDLVDLVEYC